MGARIPEALWSRAAELAATHGVAKVAASLRLDYYRLKRRVTGEVRGRHPDAPGLRRNDAGPAAFGTWLRVGPRRCARALVAHRVDPPGRQRGGGGRAQPVGGVGVIVLTPQLRVMVAVAPADFRQGIDGLARRVRQVLSDEPMSGALFVFRNRRGTAIKLLAYDGQGFWLCQKRLSQGRFRQWPTGQAGQVLAPQELAVLLAGGDWKAAAGAPVWRAVG